MRHPVEGYEDIPQDRALARREAAPLAASAPGVVSRFLGAAGSTSGGVLGIVVVGGIVGVLVYRGARAVALEWWETSRLRAWLEGRRARAEARKNARAGKGIEVREVAPPALSAEAPEGVAAVIPIARKPRRKARRVA